MDLKLKADFENIETKIDFKFSISSPCKSRRHNARLLITVSDGSIFSTDEERTTQAARTELCKTLDPINDGPWMIAISK